MSISIDKQLKLKNYQLKNVKKEKTKKNTSKRHLPQFVKCYKRDYQKNVKREKKMRANY